MLTVTVGRLLNTFCTLSHFRVWGVLDAGTSKNRVAKTRCNRYKSGHRQVTARLDHSEAALRAFASLNK